MKRLPRSIRRLALKVACLTGIAFVFRRINRKRLLIVCYHGVTSGPRAGTTWLLLQREQFERQIDYLSRVYKIVSIDEGLRNLEQGLIDTPTACITFDDGYLNNMLDAFPVLAAKNASATIYLPTGLIGTSEILWTTRLELCLESVIPRIVDLSTVDLGIHNIRTLGDARRAASEICSMLKRLGPRVRKASIKRIEGLLELAEIPSADEFRLLSWSQVLELADSKLISFGAHTVNHEIVSNLDDAELQCELIESVDHVAGALDGELASSLSSTFAYPNGGIRDFDLRAKQMLRAKGCIAAVSTIEGLVTKGDDPFELKRVVVGGDNTLDEFKLRCSGVSEVTRAIVKGILK